MARIVVGTAGHIDHGKSALVRALTGTDPDRLPEEKRRGITVDLGYAFLDDLAAVIDVPGHERLIRNMVAGAATIDYALLVVAADDGMMPQTVEHLSILQLLGLRKGCIVLTKCDIVDPDWIEMVEDQIRTAVSGTFLADAPVYRVDSISGIGIPEFKKSLMYYLSTLSPRADRGVFRLPIDRVFVMKGRGTVVTGTILSGSVSKDARLIALPGESELRVKKVESHGSEVDTARSGQRAALNIVGETDGVSRGKMLTTSGSLLVSRRIGVFISLLPASGELKNNQRIRFLISTQEVIGRLQIISIDETRRACFANIFLEEAVASVWGDRFILRRYSPLETLGGGIVLDADARSKRSDRVSVKDIYAQLLTDDLNEALKQYLIRAAPAGIARRELAARFGIPPEEVQIRLRNPIAEGQISVLADWIISQTELERSCSMILERLTFLQKANPENVGFGRIELRYGSLRNLPDVVYDAALRNMEMSGRAICENGLFRQPLHKISITDAQNRMLDRIQSILDEADFMPPSAAVIARMIDKTIQEVEKSLVLLEKLNRARRLSADLFFGVSSFDNATSRIISEFDRSPELTVASATQLLHSSRKYVVPFLEYLDGKGITARMGNVRVRGPKAVDRLRE